nr:cyclin-like protein [Melanopsichium pennsylvanicum 4]
MLLNPLATRQQLEISPSMTDGLSYALEMELRALGCHIIQQAGMLLRLPQRTMAVAQVFYQRFWFTSSMCDFSAADIAMGALLLSTKLEETQISLRHMVNAFHFVHFHLNKHLVCQPGGTTAHQIDEAGVSRSSPLGSASPPYHAPAYDSAELSRLRDATVVSEMQILKRLGFDVQVTLPYALLVNYLQALGLTDPNLKVTVKLHRTWDVELGAAPTKDISPERISIAQSAWSFLNDA